MLLTSQEMHGLIQLIYAESGLVFDQSKADVIESRISRRLQEWPGLTPSEYVWRLRTEKGQELRQLLDLLTINETYFHRDLPQLRHFAEYLLRPALAARAARQYNRLRIWSAGCSIGCEPYTLAILINEELQAANLTVDWQITATDISLSALDVARSGLYNERELRDVPPAVRPRYFTQNGDYWQFTHPCKSRVQFSYANLVQLGAAVQGPFDFIFCRNVLIYFDDAGRRRVADMFYDLLAPGGAVFLGSSESMGRISRAFELTRVGPGLVYIKE